MTIRIILPSRVFSGHERMLFRWLAKLRSLGCGPMHAHISESTMIRDAVDQLGCSWSPSFAHSGPSTRRDGLTQRLADLAAMTCIAHRSAPQDALLFAPGCYQLALMPLLANATALRTCVIYTPMAQSSRALGGRAPALKDAVVSLLSGFASSFVTVSEAQASLLRSRHAVRRTILVAPNAFPPYEAVKRESAGQVRILVLGRLDGWQKGLDWLLGVVATSRNRLRQLRVSFTIKGDGPYGARVSQFATLLPDLIRHEPHGDPCSAYGTHDILLLTSRFEGLPLVALEAAAAGTCVLATDRCGLDAFLTDEQMFHFSDADDMLARISHALIPQNRARMASGTRDRVLEYLASDTHMAASHWSALLRHDVANRNVSATI